MLKVRGRLVKVDPDIYYKIINCPHEPPYKKYNGDITSVRLSSAGYPVIIRRPRTKALAPPDHDAGLGRDKTKPDKHIQLSWFVMNAKKGEIVDHIYGNPLDNRRSSLRIVTSRQNNLNKRCRSKTGFIGVYLRHCRGKDYSFAQFRKGDGKLLSFHLPDSPENRILAALARDKFVLQSGDEDYAPLNFPRFKDEPFRSFLLKENLNEYKKQRKKEALPNDRAFRV